MKSIIDDKVYDTDMADLLITDHYDGGLTDQLYINYSGEFFLYGGLYNAIRPLYPITAEYWSKRYARSDVYKEVRQINNLLKWKKRE